MISTGVLFSTRNETRPCRNVHPHGAVCPASAEAGEAFYVTRWRSVLRLEHEAVRTSVEILYGD
jgi:hypothetical protein